MPLKEQTKESVERNPDWSRDELIVALDFYLRYREQIPGKTSKEIAALSTDLNLLGRQLQRRGSETFRNVNGVYMKLMNFRRLDPDYTAGGGVGLTRGAHADELTWNEFSPDPTRLRRIAQVILDAIHSDGRIMGADLSVGNQDDPDIAEASEGALITRMHRSRERSRKIVQEKKRATLKVRGNLACEACGFDFEKVYGERGHGFAEQQAVDHLLSP